ncbi:hypothetical protein BDV33DRAFT_209238 [Aspergillus novoparasiticus]|uniref:Uncharacterized protein n=1 Tax=Aspergillus novoparasiticus TaxID=986946 RepID=A0A5N6ECG5_9EURO|nr:hypothetical protein BDV33DRAFT_209238 [Aspergillus novoparasiticus]
MDDTMIGRFLSELPWDDPSRKPRGRPMLRRFNNYDKYSSYQELLGCGGEGLFYRFQAWTYKPDYCRSIGVSKSRWPYIMSFAHECRALARPDSMGENGTWSVSATGGSNYLMSSSNKSSANEAPKDIPAGPSSRTTSRTG